MVIDKTVKKKCECECECDCGKYVFKCQASAGTHVCVCNVSLGWVLMCDALIHECTCDLYTLDKCKAGIHKELQKKRNDCKCVIL